MFEPTIFEDKTKNTSGRVSLVSSFSTSAFIVFIIRFMVQSYHTPTSNSWFSPRKIILFCWKYSEYQYDLIKIFLYSLKLLQTISKGMRKFFFVALFFFFRFLLFSLFFLFCLYFCLQWSLGIFLVDWKKNVFFICVSIWSSFCHR